MHRRNLLKSMAAVAAGGGVTAAARTTRPNPPAKTVPPSYIETRDHTALYYREWGAGKPVLFIHSWGLNSDMWQYQMIDLTGRGLRSIAYDRRGHGRSTDPGRGYDFDTLADDLAAVLEQLDLREVTLVGHSMGAGEIVRYLTRHGAARIARAALLAPITPFVLKTADNPEGLDAHTFDHVRETWTRDFPAYLAGAAKSFVTPATSPAMLEWLGGLVLQSSLKALIDLNRVVVETDFRAEMRKISVPVLVIHGDADTSATLELTGRRTAQLIPNARLTVYEGAPHGLFITHIDRVNADLAAFIGVATSNSN